MALGFVWFVRSVFDDCLFIDEVLFQRNGAAIACKFEINSTVYSELHSDIPS
jgi:hypothetical protein